MHCRKSFAKMQSVLEKYGTFYSIQKIGRATNSTQEFQTTIFYAMGILINHYNIYWNAQMN